MHSMGTTMARFVLAYDACLWRALVLKLIRKSSSIHLMVPVTATAYNRGLPRTRLPLYIDRPNPNSCSPNLNLIIIQLRCGLGKVEQCLLVGVLTLVKDTCTSTGRHPKALTNASDSSAECHSPLQVLIHEHYGRTGPMPAWKRAHRVIPKTCCLCLLIILACRRPSPTCSRVHRISDFVALGPW
jgi:hypothetical protein